MSAPFTKFPSTAKITPCPFRIAIPDEQLSELKTLIKLSKVGPQTYENLQQDRRFGVTHEWISARREEWLNKFDWRATEAHVNSFPQYTTEIEGLTIHFAALFSEKPDAIPIVLLHGWPGSYFEFLPLLQLYRDQFAPNTLPYHLIVPSLPGYVFSSGPPLDKNWGNADSARIIDQLMQGLGVGGGYVAQGGDIGSTVARLLGSGYDGCKAVHLNFCPIPSSPPGASEQSLSELEKRGLELWKTFLSTGRAYALEHATRPATIGHVLASSPLALLAWLGEKYLEWPDSPFSSETILELVTLYWLTDSFPRACYPYREIHPDATHRMMTKTYIHKPLGFSYFPKELMPVPKSWIEKTGNLVYFNQHTEGGHFAALERPKEIKEDLEKFISLVWPGAQSS
ncbi:epoxide hydrolase family protein [Aspergillus lucknowensis]|uniref:Alpha/Beta hydrolase protein n=1 Tax=Aspergillus lucknowensis TaxID=176173 RepID=A0ABR4LR11_9EURO